MGNYKHDERRGQLRRFAYGVVLISLFAVNAQAQNRMPPIPDEDMTAAQKEAVEEFRATRG